jgi:hypothetical protein
VVTPLFLAVEAASGAGAVSLIVTCCDFNCILSAECVQLVQTQTAPFPFHSTNTASKLAQLSFVTIQ